MSGETVLMSVTHPHQTVFYIFSVLKYLKIGAIIDVFLLLNSARM